VKLTVSATDARGVGQVELLVNGKKVAADATTPYTFSVKTSRYGRKIKVQARAYDKAGNSTTSAARVWKR
jgi:hypothetical protein